MSERPDKHEKRKMLKANAATDLSTESASGQEDSGGIDQSLFEKRLEGLRDTQESVQGLSLWCQANKRHSSPIIETWLKVLRKSPVEKRLTLFYLSNDVIQHAKRKGDSVVVNQWAFAIQKATPLVRTPSSVSSAIARIFRIWEERSVYSKDTVADLLALLNNVPAKERVGEKKKPETYTASADKVSAFNPSILISKVKLAYRLKSHLGASFRAKPLVHMDMEALKASIKDRSHGMEVVQEIGQLVEQLKTSETKLLSEVEERRKIVEMAEVAIVSFENIRGEAKIVNSAYKNFTERVLATKAKVDDKIRAFDEMEKDVSPVPSPPPNAPSPPPDEDDFGLRPADSLGSSHWSQNHSASTDTIRSDIMDALKTAISTSAPSPPSMQPSYSSSSGTDSNHLTSSSGAPYDPTMGGSMPSMSAMQQQFSQSWGGSNDGGYAAMSAMIQQMLPGANSYLQSMQPPQSHYQPTGNYATGYETYQPQPPPLPNLDIGSIPLPPVPNSEPPPPPHNHGHDGQMSRMQNPYQQQSSVPDSSSSTDEYVPYHPQDSQKSYPITTYGDHQQNSSYDYTPATPTGPPSGGRYHPYGNSGSGDRHRRGSESGSSSGGGPLAKNSQASTPNSPYSSIGPVDISHSNNSSVQFDPMEMFQSALNKGRGGGGSMNVNINSGTMPPLTPPSNHNNRSLSSEPSPPNQPNFGQPPPQNQYYTSAGYDTFDNTDTSRTGSNGNEVEFIEAYTPRKPEMGNFVPRGRGLISRGGVGAPRGTGLRTRGPRMRGGGVGRGPSPRGFVGGFRGRGAPRGSAPRGGGGFLFQ